MIKFKRFGLLLSILFILIISVTLAACNNASNNENGSESETSAPTNNCAHAESEWSIKTAPTCSAEGVKVKTCLSCKAELDSIKLESISHTATVVEGKLPTCAEAGLTEGKKCSVCDAVVVAQTEIAALPHTEKLIDGKNATCTEAGLTEGKSCSVCNAVLVEQKTIYAHGHIEVVSEIVYPTANESGLSQGSHCAVCNTVIKSQETIPPLGDSTDCVYIETPEISATCATEGMTAGSVCVTCHKTESGREPVAKLAHTEEILPGITPTCKSTGLTEGKKCSVCSEVLNERSPLAKADHIIITHLGKDAACESLGSTSYTSCAFCLSELSSSLTVNAKGHTFESGICVGCGIEETYGITVVDGNGNPVSDIFIRIKQNGEQIKLAPYNGKFLSLGLEDGEYTFELDLSQLEIEYVYDESACVLTPDSPSAKVILYRPVSNPTQLFVGAPILKDYNAYSVTEGAYKATLTGGGYNLFIFRPTTPGIYEIICESAHSVTYSYHGSTFFTQGTDLSPNTNDIKKTDNSLLITVYADNMGSDYVIGITAEESEDCTISIKNVGEAPQSVDEDPWIPHLEDANKVKEHLSVKSEGNFTPIDLTDLTISAVFNSNDGFYHLNSVNGPIIYIDLTTDTSYVASIKTICAHQRMGTIIYDVNGKLIEKRSYNELFAQYGMPLAEDESVDGAIRIPLTAKLAEAIKNFGEQNHWWDPMSEMNIFNKVLMGSAYNSQYAWLLFCGIYQ